MTEELSAVSEDNILPEGTERAGRANLDDVLQEERALDEAVEGVVANDREFSCFCGLVKNDADDLAVDSWTESSRLNAPVNLSS